MATKPIEYRIIMILADVEACEAIEASIPSSAAQITVKWFDSPVKNQEAVAEAIGVLNSTYCG